MCIDRGGSDRSVISDRSDRRNYEELRIGLFSSTQTFSFMLSPGNLKHVPRQLSASEWSLITVESLSSSSPR